jgi:hypothetical protein
MEKPTGAGCIVNPAALRVRMAVIRVNSDVSKSGPPDSRPAGIAAITAGNARRNRRRGANGGAKVDARTPKTPSRA